MSYNTPPPRGDQNGAMPYDRELKPWPHPEWLALSVWKAVMLAAAIVYINHVSWLILWSLLTGFRP